MSGARSAGWPSCARRRPPRRGRVSPRRLLAAYELAQQRIVVEGRAIAALVRAGDADSIYAALHAGARPGGSARGGRARARRARSQRRRSARVRASPRCRWRPTAAPTSPFTAGDARDDRRSRSCSTRAGKSRGSVSRHRTRCRPTRTPVAACVPAWRCRSTAPGGSSGAVRLSGRTTTSSRPTSATRTTSSCGGSVRPIAAPGRRTPTTGPGGNRARAGRRPSSWKRSTASATTGRRCRSRTRTDPAGNHVVLGSRHTASTHCWRTCRGAASGSEPAIPCAGRTVLGLTGNSGNSSEPHLHFHVQDQPDLFSGARGLPVSFVDYRADGRRVARGTPLQGQFIQRG